MGTDKENKITTCTRDKRNLKVNTAINDAIECNPHHFPRRVTLELTNKCNLNCVFCPRRVMAKHSGFLDLNLSKRLLDEIAEHIPVAVVPFFRGEPLLHPNWDEILTYMKHKGIGPIQLTTNATLLTQEAAEKIIDIGVDFISFSLDTLNAEEYEKARRGAKYTNVVENISRLLTIKSQSQKQLPEIQVSAIDIPQYQDGLDAFIKFWQPQVDRVRIYIEHSQDGHPGSIAAPLPHFEKRLPCQKVFTDMVILWDGEVALCNHDWTREKEEHIGNVSSESIASIWRSAKYENIRTMHVDGDVTKEKLCQHCDHWKMYYLPEGYLGQIYTRHQQEHE